MAELEPVGHQLVIVTLLFGIVAFITLSVRIGFRIRNRKYDVSDTCLVAAMVRSSHFSHQALLTDIIDLWCHAERYSDHSCRSVRIWKAKADIPSNLRTSVWPVKLAYINQIIFKLTTPLCKLSLCFLYRNMCSTSTDRIIRMTRLAIQGTIYLSWECTRQLFLLASFNVLPSARPGTRRRPRRALTLSRFA